MTSSLPAKQAALLGKGRALNTKATLQPERGGKRQFSLCGALGAGEGQAGKGQRNNSSGASTTLSPQHAPSH